MNVYCVVLTVVLFLVILYISRQIYFRFKRPNYSFIASAPHPICISDCEGNIRAANEKALDLFGYTTEEFLSLKVEQLMPVIYRKKHRVFRKQFCSSPASRSMGAGRELPILTKNGKEILTEIALGHIQRNNHNSILVAFHDVSERKKQERMIHRLAFYDSLTGLPNRENFHQHMVNAVERAKENDKGFAIFMVDLSKFKRFNETFGQQMGDELLKHVAYKLKHVVDVRCDDELLFHDFCARLGGDEFVLVIEQINNSEQAEFIVERIFDTFINPEVIKGHEVHVSLSVGIGLYPVDGNDADSLLKSAELALHHAQSKGLNQFHFHESGMNIRVEEHIKNETILRDIIATGDFQLAYQPIVEIPQLVLCGAEALFRGPPHKTDTSPGELIQIAEESGLIVKLGRLIFHKACSDCVQSHKQGQRFVVSINVSIRELNEPDFVDFVVATIEETGIRPFYLTIEITESLFMINYTENVRKIEELRERGVQISIDDFGKGYSSMSHLHRLPASKLKIDKEFIDNISTDEKSEQIVKAITVMAHSLGMVVCAEGVESIEQIRKIENLGIEQVQGYLTGRPIPLSEFLQCLSLNQQYRF